MPKHPGRIVDEFGLEVNRQVPAILSARGTDLPCRQPGRPALDAVPGHAAAALTLAGLLQR